MAYKLVGYYENWAQYRPDGQGKFLPEQIDPTLFTHINFAFGLFGFITWSVDPTATRTGPQRLTGDFTIQPPGAFRAFCSQRARSRARRPSRQKS